MATFGAGVTNLNPMKLYQLLLGFECLLGGTLNSQTENTAAMNY